MTFNSTQSPTKAFPRPSKTYRQKQWVIPPVGDTEFVYDMEDVLALYHDLYDPNRPVVCKVEHPNELIVEVHDSHLTTVPVAKYDHHYNRQGTKNLFLASQSPTRWRTISVAERRTIEDWATFIMSLVDEHIPRPKHPTGPDILNTHRRPSGSTAKRPRPDISPRKWEFHFRSVHGSWLNVTEMEFNALCGQCLERRIPEGETLR